MAQLLFLYGFDEQDQDEAQARGYLNHVLVELDDGKKYSVVFYDAIRLRQDLEEETKLGNRFISEPGMIVLEEVTLENMQAAISQLEQENYFASLVAVQNLTSSTNLQTQEVVTTPV